jgi:hypothetical protein
MNNINFRSPLAGLFLAGCSSGGYQRAGSRRGRRISPVTRYHGPLGGAGNNAVNTWYAGRHRNAR